MVDFSLVYFSTYIGVVAGAGGNGNQPKGATGVNRYSPTRLRSLGLHPPSLVLCGLVFQSFVTKIRSKNSKFIASSIPIYSVTFNVNISSLKKK